MQTWNLIKTMKYIISMFFKDLETILKGTLLVGSFNVSCCIFTSTGHSILKCAQACTHPAMLRFPHKKRGKRYWNSWSKSPFFWFFCVISDNRSPSFWYTKGDQYIFYILQKQLSTFNSVGYQNVGLLTHKTNEINLVSVLV